MNALKISILASAAALATPAWAQDGVLSEDSAQNTEIVVVDHDRDA